MLILTLLYKIMYDRLMAYISGLDDDKCKTDLLYSTKLTD